MASASDIAEVRLNTNLADDDPTYTDELLNEYVDALGVAGATAKVWSQLAAQYVDEASTVTEAGATHKFETRKNALEMAQFWAAIAAAEFVTTSPTVSDIVRET